MNKVTEAASLRERCIQINQHLVSNCLSDKPYKKPGNYSSCAMKTGDIWWHQSEHGDAGRLSVMYSEHWFTPFSSPECTDSCEDILIPQAVFHSDKLNQLISHTGRDGSVSPHLPFPRLWLVPHSLEQHWAFWESQGWAENVPQQPDSSEPVLEISSAFKSGGDWSHPPPAPAWNVAARPGQVPPERAPGDCDGAAPAGREKLGFTQGGNDGIPPSRAYLHLLYLPVAFPYSFSAIETQNGFVVSPAQETSQQFRISPSLPTVIIWSFEWSRPFPLLISMFFKTLQSSE